MSNTLLQQYGPWALIAGGSEGIGLCFARQLAAAGINLVLIARRSAPLQAAKEQLLRDYPVEVRIQPLDLTAADLEAQLIGLTGGAYIAAYAATKAFDIVLAESLWAELAPCGVHVLSLVAGATDTPAMTASGIRFEPGYAMDPMAVAREGLAQLPHGPLHVAGDNNRGVAAILRSEDRRQSVALMSAGSAALYGLPVPQLPGAGAQ